MESDSLGVVVLSCVLSDDGLMLPKEFIVTFSVGPTVLAPEAITASCTPPLAFYSDQMSSGMLVVDISGYTA